MPTTFAEYIARAHMDAAYVLRISGLPYLFASVPIPSRWGGPTVVVHEGEDYTWLPILRVGDDFAAPSTRIEPKGGVGQSGGCDFDLMALGYQSATQQEDTLLSLLLSSVGRGDGKLAASLAADLPADESGVGTSLTMIANPWASGSPPTRLYLGTETITLATHTVNSATVLTSTVTRAAFGSQAQTHTGAVRDGGAVAGGAMYIADYPLTLVGRVAELWCVPGEFRRGGFYPHGATLADGANRIVYAGIVDGHSEDGATVTIRTSSLDQYLKGAVLRDAPTVTARTDLQWRELCYIGAHNWWVHLDLEVDGSVNYPLIYIPDNTALTAGDTITIVPDTFIAGTDWTIGANVLITIANITNAINAGAGFPTSYSALNIGNAIEVRAGSSVGTPSTVGLSFTTTNPGAITSGSTNLQPTSIRQLLGARLRRSTNADGAAPFEDVPEGLYPWRTLGGYLTDTLTEWLPRPLELLVSLSYVANATTEGGRCVMGNILNPARQGRAVRIVWITERQDQHSFLRDLGFTEPEFEVTREETGVPENAYEATANRAPAALRIPAFPYEPPARVYITNRDAWSAAWFLAAGWEDDDGDPILPHVHNKDIGLLVVQSVGADAGGTYLGGVARASSALGSQNKEEIYIEYSDTEPKTLDFARVVALPNVSANRMMLYLMLGGSGYGTNHATWDQGWPGCGLHIPARLVADADWTALDLARPEPRDGWVWVPKDDARKVLDEELKATQQQIVSDLGQLRLVAMDVPLEAAPLPRRIIGPEQTVTDPDKGVGVDRQPNRIVNVVNVKGGWDARTGAFDLLDQINRQQDSIGTWGEQQAIEVELRGLSGLGDAQAKGRAVAQRIFGLYARPYALVEVDLAPRSAWLWAIGDEVELTHPWVPHPTLPRRGCTAMLCRIVNKVPRFGGSSGKAFVTLTLQSYALAGQRYSIWGPSAQLLYSGTANTWSVVEDTYGDTVNGVADSDYFAVDYAVKTMRLGDSSSAPVTRLVAIKTGAVGFVTLKFSAALAGSSGERYVMWYADHDHADTTDAQRRFAYMSNFSGALTLPSGTAPAFRYR